MKAFTIGYGNRDWNEFVDLLKRHGIATVVDVRLRPDKARLGTWVKAKTAEKGIEKRLADVGIGYVSLVEMGNVFMRQDNALERYRRLLEAAGELLTARLADVPGPWCLLCAEQDVAKCHRGIVAEYLATHQGIEFEHL